MLEQLAAAGTLPRHRPGWRSEPSALAGLTGDDQPRVAVLIPCCNEEVTIGKVVTDFHAVMPHAVIYVYDNNSTDRTLLEARAAGAMTRAEPLQGKGHVVRRMFADVEADVFILVDGDDTYDAAAAPTMLQLLLDQQLDMVTGARSSSTGQTYRPGHRFGNRVLTALVRHAFGQGITDLLSGYRVFSRRFVKSFPALAGGFETETEFSVHALALHMPIHEVATVYRERPVGSRSKLNTIRDGLRILRAIIAMIEHERPLPSFSIAGAILLGAGIGLGVPVLVGFLHTGLVERLPTALLSTGLVLLSCLAVTCGLILDAVARGRRELRRLAYLSLPAAGIRR